jgi:hypothetical protein
MIHKDFEDCNKEEQEGWAVGQGEYLDGNLPGEDIEEFVVALREKYSEWSTDFLNGAEWGARAEG